MADNDNQLIQQVRQLLSGAFDGVLATHSTEHPGYPFGSLVPYSLDREGWPLLLLSHLAKHTRNLTASSQCSLTLTGPEQDNVQEQPRLTCLADAHAVASVDHELAERHFRYYPQSRDYYEQLNFRFYRLEPVRFYTVGGFGAARWLGKGRLTQSNPYGYADERSALEVINRHIQERGDEMHQAVGIDPLGVDIRRGAQVQRLELLETAATPTEISAQLPRLLARLHK